MAPEISVRAIHSEYTFSKLRSRASRLRIILEMRDLAQPREAGLCQVRRLGAFPVRSFRDSTARLLFPDWPLPARDVSADGSIRRRCGKCHMPLGRRMPSSRPTHKLTSSSSTNQPLLPPKSNFQGHQHTALRHSRHPGKFQRRLRIVFVILSENYDALTHNSVAK